MFEPEVFRKQMYCIEERTCDIVGTFSAPSALIRRPGSCAPFAPLITPSLASNTSTEIMINGDTDNNKNLSVDLIHQRITVDENDGNSFNKHISPIDHIHQLAMIVQY